MVSGSSNTLKLICLSLRLARNLTFAKPTMFFTSVSLFMFLLYIHLGTIIAGEVKCLRWSKPEPTAVHCQAAIDLIPDGRIFFNGQDGSPLNFYLPPTAHQHNHHTSPVWRAGNCGVRVQRCNWFQPVRITTPPHLAASALYFKLWPAVKQAAVQVSRECFSALHANDAGYLVINPDLYGLRSEYIVTVGKGLPKLPEKSGPFTMCADPKFQGLPPSHYLHQADEGAGKSRAPSSR